MLTPTYSLTANERILPVLDINFLTAVADSRVTTTRSANTATRTNSSGTLEVINANLPRFDYDPTSLVCLGQLIEEERTNLLLNSLIDGTNLATQSVTLSAVAYTLSFYGTGSVAISGGHTYTLNGTGDYPTRVSYTFTPTAGSSTFTVTGAVKYANLEAGSTATSFIPTAGASVLRNADAVTMTSTNFSSWYNSTEGTVSVRFSTSSTSGNGMEIRATSGNTDFIRVARSTNSAYFRVFSSSVEQCGLLPAITGSSWSTGVTVVGAYKANSFAASAGSSPNLDTSGAVPVSPTNANIGSATLGAYINGHMKRIRYWNVRAINNEVYAFSKAT